MSLVVLKWNSFMRLTLLTRNFMLLICDSSAYYAIRVWQLLFIRDFCVGDQSSGAQTVGGSVGTKITECR